LLRMRHRAPRTIVFPYTTLFRSNGQARVNFAMIAVLNGSISVVAPEASISVITSRRTTAAETYFPIHKRFSSAAEGFHCGSRSRSEEHTSELQSRFDLVCRLLLE